MKSTRKHPALGILFKGLMVRAILAGSKTQTRRTMKVQPPADTDQMQYKIATTVSSTSAKDEGKHHWLGIDRTLDYNALDTKQTYFNCPISVGDILYVKETWATEEECIETDNGCFAGPESFIYRADRQGDMRRWEPSLFMPYEAARIFLKVTGVRVERLNDISEADAIAEGIEQIDTMHPNAPVWKDYRPKCNNSWMSAVNSYLTLWDSINGEGSAEINPYVWVYTFERTDKPTIPQ